MAEEKTTIKQWAGRVGAVVLVGMVGFGVWRMATGENDAVKRKAAEVSMLMPTLPPPPPPPPPEEPVPEDPEDVVEDPTPQPTPQPDQPAPSPSAATSEGTAVSIDGAAQAGGDAFNIAAGAGSGRTGGGPPGLGSAFGRREYARYFGGAVSQHLNRNRSGDLRNAVVQAQVRIWVTATGGVSRVEFANGTGNPDVDAEIRRLLLSMPAGRAPPADVLANQPVVTRINLRRNS